MELVTLTTCWNTFEAEMIKNRLEEAGIICILQGAASSGIRIGAGVANCAFEIPVLVMNEDLRAAYKFLEEAS